MASTSDSSKQQPAAAAKSKFYWAIRHCDSLQSPAIFTSWEDCSFYIDQSENDDVVQYKKCASMQEAASYIEISPPSPILSQGVEEPVILVVGEKRSAAADGSCDPPNKRVKKAQEKFERNFKLLEEYVEEHGTCDIPNNHPSIQNEKFQRLDGWIVEMRRQIKLFQSKEPTCMLNEQKVNQLLELGFVMKPTRAKEERRRATLENSWEDMLLLLKDYVKENGHACVGEKHNPPGLFRWTVKLREDFAKMKENQECFLTQERIDELSALGFDFTPSKQRKNFEERAHEWLEFRTKHGREPKRETVEEPLAVWATKTRRKYEQFQRGEKTNITKEQIDLLTRWGFKWQIVSKFAPVCKATEFKSWEERFADLEAYKEEKGDCLVPQAYPGLGPWVKRQRKEYQKIKKDGVKSRMTKEKMKKLKQIGFVFEVRKRALPMATAAAAPPEESDGDEEEETEEEEEESEGEYHAPSSSTHHAYAHGGGGYHASPSQQQRDYSANHQHLVANAMASMRSNFDQW